MMATMIAGIIMTNRTARVPKIISNAKTRVPVFLMAGNVTVIRIVFTALMKLAAVSHGIPYLKLSNVQY